MRLHDLSGGVTALLTDRDAASACAIADSIAAASRESAEWYGCLDEFLALLEHKNSLVRNRAMSILAANARWDDGRYGEVLDRLLPHITDEKPISSRQCVKALAEIAQKRPQYARRIASALKSADLSGYKDSMRPLILKDITAALRQMEENVNEE